jgi:hypothetical protein
MYWLFLVVLHSTTFAIQLDTQAECVELALISEQHWYETGQEESFGVCMKSFTV